MLIIPMPRLLLFIIFSTITSAITAQQLSLFTQYREQAGIINPAALHSNYLLSEGDNNLHVGLSYRSQWTELTTTPRTQVLNGSYFFDDSGAGVSFLAGGYLINDQTGPTGFTGGYLRLGGVVSDNPDYSGFAIGITAGAVQYRVDASEIDLRDANDILGTQDQSQIFPDIGVGIYYYRQLESGFLRDDYIYGGVSVPQVIGLELTFRGDEGEFFTQRLQHFYAQAGMIKYRNRDQTAFLEPSVWVKYVQGAPINVDFNLRYQVAEPFWIGTGLSTGGNLHLETGFRLGQEDIFNIGYGFDYSFSSFGPFVGGTHELNLAVSLVR